MSRLLLRFAATLPFALAVLTGCAASDEPQPLDQKAVIPAALQADIGTQFVMPATRIAKGEERMVCWVPDWPRDEDVLVAKFEGVQGSMGHHVLAMQSDVFRTPGSTFDCSSVAQMINLRPLVLPEFGDQPVLPPGHAVRLPKDKQVVIQSHYVNYADRDIEVRDVARFHFAPAQPQTEVSYLIANDAAIVLPPGKTTRTASCTVPDDMKLLLTIGHMHQYGRTLAVDVVRAAGGPSERIYDVPEWTAEYRDSPPPVYFDANKPLALAKGDRVEVTCSWDNTTGKTLKFPSEMCTSISFYYPALPQGMIVCDVK